MLAWASLMIFCGVIMLLFPTEAMVLSPGGWQGPAASGVDFSKGEARVFGGLVAVVGCGLVWLIFYRRNKMLSE